MAENAKYRPSFSDLAAEFVLSLPKRRQRAVMNRAYELARYPFLESDYRLMDRDGRVIEHLLVDGGLLVLGRSRIEIGDDHRD